MAHPSAATPVYNVPMAVSGSSNRTLGLEPERAMARNLQHLAAARQCTLGPMPVQSFLDSFLPVPASVDRSGLLPSDGTFASVPLCARHPAGIIKPLVSFNFSSSYPPPTQRAACSPQWEFVVCLSLPPAHIQQHCDT